MIFFDCGVASSSPECRDCLGIRILHGSCFSFISETCATVCVSWKRYHSFKNAFATEISLALAEISLWSWRCDPIHLWFWHCGQGLVMFR